MTQGQTLHENSEHFLSSSLGWSFKQISIPLTKKEFHSLQKKFYFCISWPFVERFEEMKLIFVWQWTIVKKLIVSKKKIRFFLLFEMRLLHAMVYL